MITAPPRQTRERAFHHLHHAHAACASKPPANIAREVARMRGAAIEGVSRECASTQRPQQPVVRQHAQRQRQRREKDEAKHARRSLLADTSDTASLPGWISRANIYFCHVHHAVHAAASFRSSRSINTRRHHIPSIERRRINAAMMLLRLTPSAT